MMRFRRLEIAKDAEGKGDPPTPTPTGTAGKRLRWVGLMTARVSRLVRRQRALEGAEQTSVFFGTPDGDPSEVGERRRRREGPNDQAIAEQHRRGLPSGSDQQEVGGGIADLEPEPGQLGLEMGPFFEDRRAASPHAGDAVQRLAAQPGGGHARRTWRP